MRGIVPCTTIKIKDTLNSEFSVPEKVTLFGNGVIAEVDVIS